jgi:predicted nucleic acid-binding protein
MRLLLDTCVISEMHRSNGNHKLKELIDVIDEKDVFISVVSLGEIIKGVFLLEEGKRKKELLSWVGGFERFFADRILGIDPETAHIWGEVTAKAQKTGKIVPACDGLIASIALRHGLHLVTRNSSDFLPMGVMLIDPWKTSP